MVRTPYLRKSEKIPLRFAISVNFVVDGFALSLQRIQKRHVGNAQAAIIRRILAQCQLAV